MFKKKPSTNPEQVATTQVEEALARRRVEKARLAKELAQRIECGLVSLREFYEQLCTTSRNFRIRWKRLGQTGQDRIIRLQAEAIYSCPGRPPSGVAYSVQRREG